MKSMQVDDIKAILQKQLPDCDSVVANDNGCWHITVIGALFAELNELKRQQKIYAALNPYIRDGSIHAVRIKTYTAEEHAHHNDVGVK